MISRRFDPWIERTKNLDSSHQRPATGFSSANKSHGDEKLDKVWITHFKGTLVIGIIDMKTIMHIDSVWG